MDGSPYEPEVRLGKTCPCYLALDLLERRFVSAVAFMSLVFHVGPDAVIDGCTCIARWLF